MTTDLQFDERLKGEFVDEARDIINEIDVMLGNVRSGLTAPAEALTQLRRHSHNLRIGSRGLGLPAIELILHRLEDYLAGIGALGQPQMDDVQTFGDRLRAAFTGDIPSDLRQLVRELPSFDRFDVNDVTRLDVTVLLVTPQRMLANFVQRELKQCGYRVINVMTSFEAIEMAVRTHPDLIISAAVLDELSGIDLASAMAAMPTTRSIAFALLTSFEKGHHSLEGAPPTTAMLRKGPEFGDDLADALSRFGIT